MTGDVLTHLDLFSGIGGIALAARWAGFRTRLFCEIEPYAQRVLRKHWPRVPIHDDVRTLTRTTLHAHGLDRPTLLTGGFPCQPFSCAGKRKGAADDRHLWPEMLRVIRECWPAWVVAENVAGFVRLALDDCLTDLEGEGYACRTFVLPACAVGAPHRRHRTFVVGHADDGGFEKDLVSSQAHEGGPVPQRRCWRNSAPRICRVADGVPAAVDRLRGLGNAVVPQQIYPILAGIAAATPLVEVSA